ncbi:MAG: hypothetical protein ACTHKU_12585 [Verrucomicrobiota bacterium]
MPMLRDSTLDEVLTHLESWKPYHADNESDLFVAAIGFEDRASTCFVSWCMTRKGRGAKALLIEYPFNKEDNAVQEAKFVDAARVGGVEVFRCKYQQLALYGETVRFFTEHGQKARILLDLSAMASFVFYPLMSAITDVATNATLEVCYAEATHYFPEEGEWNEFKEKFKNLDLVDRARLFDQYHFQSKGVENVFESLNFPGRNDSQPTTLVVIPNFSVERVQRMLNFAADNYSINREECEWIIGMPPEREKNGWRYDALWELFNEPSRKRDACTLGFKEILHGLQAIWLETRDNRSLVIASVASKAQHLGTFMFLTMHPEVGLVLSEPKQFTASKYSSGVGLQWHTSFGVVGDWVSRLRDWNKIIFTW